MFSWICPQCGHDVPPSKTECPYCAERAQQAAAAGYPLPPQPPGQNPPAQPYPPAAQAPPAWQPPAPPPPPAPPVYQAPQGYAPPQPYPPQYPPPPQYAPQPPQQQPMAWPPPQRKQAPSPLLVGGGFALALILVFGGIYYFMSRPESATSNSGKTGATSGSATAKAVSSPLQRSLEVTGLRFVTENKGEAVKFVVVNHSTAPVSDLVGTVTLWAGTSRSDEDAIGTFNLNVDVIEAGGSKDMSAPLKTKLKAYEMPDWQNATAEVQITSPQ